MRRRARAAVAALAALASLPLSAADSSDVAEPLAHYRTAVLDDLVPNWTGRRERLLRIRRDFNNDGREDQAFATEWICGNKMCNFDLWLQDTAQRYRRVGSLEILPWGYGLEPKEPGIAELQRCSGSGVEFWGMYASTISAKGVVADAERSKTLSAAGECRIVQLDVYPCEACWVKELLKTGRCHWHPCDDE